MSWLAITGAVVFFLGVLASIALHELGHLVPAKIFDVKVTQYFIGFGKTLWSRQRGETEVGLKVIPAGGYVRLVGMLPPNAFGRTRRWSTGMFQSLIDGARSQAAEEILPGEEHRAFCAKPWWQKVIIMLGGPMVNIVLAFVLIGAAMIGIGVYQPSTVVAAVSACVPPSAAVACTTSDAESPARAAGIRAGDRFVSVNGVAATGWPVTQAAIRAARGRTVPVVLDRDGVQRRLEVDVATLVRPVLDSSGNPTGASAPTGFIGIVPEYGRAPATVGQTVDAVGSMVVLTGQAMLHIPQRMVGVVQAAFGGTRSEDSPMSVLGASRLAGEMATGEVGGPQKLAVSDRVAMLLQWLGALNLFVGLFNLIPLLPLDGGHIAGALWEAVKRGVARLRHRPDPGHVDVAKALPIAYGMAGVLAVMGVLLIFVDIVNPVRFG